MKKILGPILSILLLSGVGYAIYDSLQSQKAVEIIGLIGSEKRPFFDDPRVQKRLKKLGFIVKYQKAGSRQIATSFDLTKYDYAFPAGLPAAEKIRRENSNTKSYNPFFTPIAIASWQPIVNILQDNGMVTNKGHYYTLNMKAYLDAFNKKMRWKDLKNNSSFSVNKALLINSTDIRKSNSAAMYLSLASYVLNNNNVIQNYEQIDPIIHSVSELFKRQGFIEYSSAVPFDDYLVMGMGKAPLVLIYESQFIYKASLKDGSIYSDMVLLYPEPSLFTKHVLVSLSEDGHRFGEILETDIELQKLAIEHGFRNSNTGYFNEFIIKHQIKIGKNLVNVIEPPAYEFVEAMIQRIEQQY